MRRAILTGLLAFATGACTQAAVPGNAGESSSEPAQAVEAGKPRSDVYIAFAPQRDAASMLATFGGRFEVLNNCLVLRSETTTYVPVFSPSADTYVTDSSAVIAGKAVALGTDVQAAGGEMGLEDDAVLDRPRPAQCRHRLLRVSSWGVPGG